MHEPSYRRAWRILAAVAAIVVIAGLIVVLPGAAVWRDNLNDTASQAKLISSNDEVVLLWNRTWGDIKDDFGQGVWGDNAGNTYTCGGTYSFGAGTCDILLVKRDAEGNQLWNRTWGSKAFERAYAVWGDYSGIYICGYTLGFGAGQADIVLVKWNPSGNLLWNRTWGGASYDYAYAIWGDCAGSVYTCGTTESFGVGIANMVLVRWDTAGNQLWNRTWGSSSYDHAYAVWGDITGSIYTCVGIRSDIALVKWDPAGNQIWNRTWGGARNEYANGVWGDNIGNIYVCGNTDTFGAGGSDMVLVKWNAVGNVEWYRTLGGTYEDEGFGVWVDGAGCIFTCVHTNSEIVLVKWDMAGNQLWNRTCGSKAYEYGYPVWRVWGDGAGNIYTCGNSFNSGVKDRDMALVKWSIAPLPNKGPTITHPVDITYTAGQAGHILSWIITDATTGTRSYTIYSNGTSVASGSWTSGTPITRNVDGLLLGSHNYTIIATDGLGGSVQDSAIITVIPNLAPTITHPPDITYTSGQAGNAISWIVMDTTTGIRNYTIYHEGTYVVNGSWTTGIPITRNVNDLPIGIHYFWIVADDGLGGLVQDSVIVSVIPNKAPTITHPSDITYTRGQIGSAISWIITDASTSTRSYTIYRNGSLIASGSWTDGMIVPQGVDGLPIGSYNYTIIATDGLGGSSRDSVQVTVIPNVAPRIDCTIGHDGTTISWTFTDAGTGTTFYTLYLNGVGVANGTWTPELLVDASTSGLAPGTYNFTIVATDGLGGRAQGSVLVVVVVSGQVDGGRPGGSEPGMAWILVFGAAAAIALAMGTLFIKLGAIRRYSRNPGKARRRLTREDWLDDGGAPQSATIATRPPETAMESPLPTDSATRGREPASYCSACGEALTPALGRGQYCGHCGEPLARHG